MAFAVACLVVSGCKVESALQPGGPVASNVATVQISLRNESIVKGGATVATAIVRDQSGNLLPVREVVWSTTPMSVATVDDFGGLTGVSEGTAVVTATTDGKTGSATLRVSGSP